MEPAPKSFLAL